MTVSIAFYKGTGGAGNRLICWWTKSKYSHCEIVCDGFCYSSSVMDGGVRKKQVGTEDRHISLNPDNWDILALEYISKDKVLEYFGRTKDVTYGWKDLILSQILNRNIDKKKTSFCSEWCADLIGIPSPVIYSPDSLLKLISWINSGGLSVKK